MLEAEVSINQPVADAYAAQSLQLLDTAETETRSAVWDSRTNALGGTGVLTREPLRMIMGCCVAF